MRPARGCPCSTPLPADRRVERPAYVWLAIALEVFTAVGAIPVGLMLLGDTTGGAVGLPAGWIEATVFGSYLLPAIYLLVMNGIGMLVLAALSVLRHRLRTVADRRAGHRARHLDRRPADRHAGVLAAPGDLSGRSACVLVAISVAWLRRTGQLRLW